jgi:RNA polymerase sigma factor
MVNLSITERLEIVKKDPNELNNFIEEYKPFIASIVEKMTGRYAAYGESDELSIGLIAFNESIQKYNPQKGSFLTFAKYVITNRLIDYFRKNKNHLNTTPLEEYVGDDKDDEIDITFDKCISDFNESEINALRKSEILELKDELAKWDISFDSLLKESPKHEKKRETINMIISKIMSSPEIVDSIITKKHFPITQIQKISNIPLKFLERSRKYIITIITIKSGDYSLLKSFVNWG